MFVREKDGQEGVEQISALRAAPRYKILAILNGKKKQKINMWQATTNKNKKQEPELNSCYVQYDM